MFPVKRKKMGKGPRAMTIVTHILTPDGEIPHRKIPQHVKDLRIPPAWVNVRVELDPEAKCYAKGEDVKGRTCSLYAPHHNKAASEAKFDKTKKLLAEADSIQEKLEKALKHHADGPQFEAVTVAYLIFNTGIRPGSRTDTLADKQAYGATTLQARHVKVNSSGSVYLHFTGKKGVTIHLKVTNEWLKKELVERKNAAQGAYTTELFSCSSSALNKFCKWLYPGLNPKDMRTMKGTQTASKFLEGKRVPNQKTKAKQMLRNLFRHVADVLGNTPAIAKKSYVAPEIYKPITEAIEGM